MKKVAFSSFTRGDFANQHIMGNIILESVKNPVKTSAITEEQSTLCLRLEV